MVLVLMVLTMLVLVAVVMIVVMKYGGDHGGLYTQRPSTEEC